MPFSDPMADGTTIQRASFAALADGVTLPWILEELKSIEPRHAAPILLMSYLNPLLALGWSSCRARRRARASRASSCRICPSRKAAICSGRWSAEGLALVQMVTPVTPPERLEMLCREAKGFVYAVTMTGTTGKSADGKFADVPLEVLDYMDRVKQLATVPVCAGFGIRSARQVARFAPHVDGVVVGSALVEALERGEDVGAFLKSLR